MQHTRRICCFIWHRKLKGFQLQGFSPDPRTTLGVSHQTPIVGSRAALSICVHPMFLTWLRRCTNTKDDSVFKVETQKRSYLLFYLLTYLLIYLCSFIHSFLFTGKERWMCHLTTTNTSVIRNLLVPSLSHPYTPYRSRENR